MVRKLSLNLGQNIVHLSLPPWPIGSVALSFIVLFFVSSLVCPAMVTFSFSKYFPSFHSPFSFSSANKMFSLSKYFFFIFLLRFSSHQKKYIFLFQEFSSFLVSKCFPPFSSPPKKFFLFHVFSSFSFSAFLLLHKNIFSSFSFSVVLLLAKNLFSFSKYFYSFSFSNYLPLFSSPPEKAYIFLLQIFPFFLFSVFFSPTKSMLSSSTYFPSFPSVFLFSSEKKYFPSPNIQQSDFKSKKVSSYQKVPFTHLQP